METRREYIEKLAARLLDWDARIDELKAKSEAAGADLRLTYKKKITELRDLRERVSAELSRLHEAGDPGWQEIKKTAETLVEQAGRLLKDVEKAFRKAA
jgi:hypothetical protein